MYLIHFTLDKKFQYWQIFVTIHLFLEREKIAIEKVIP